MPSKKSKTSRAGLTFPVARLHRLLKKGKFAKRVGACGSVYLAAVLEFLCREILELAGKYAQDLGTKKILPRHLMMAIRHDDLLDKLLLKIIIPEGGVLPTISGHWIDSEDVK